MADKTPRHESITEIVPKVLKEYLEKNVSGLREAFIDFPEPNRKMKLPSVSIAANDPSFNPTGTPYPLQLPNSGDGAPVIANSQAAIKWVVGEFDFTLQLDLWAANKEELDDMYDQLFNVLNPEITPMGVRLTMKEYFNCIASFVYNGHTRQGSEERSQRDEWRITLSVLATCKAIRDRKEFIIESTDLTTDINKDVLVSG